MRPAIAVAGDNDERRPQAKNAEPGGQRMRDVAQARRTATASMTDPYGVAVTISSSQNVQSPAPYQTVCNSKDFRMIAVSNKQNTTSAKTAMSIASP
jgi:C4-type Zn-finger protein